jgi:hypothetical protein
MCTEHGSVAAGLRAQASVCMGETDVSGRTMQTRDADELHHCVVLGRTDRVDPVVNIHAACAA